MPKFLRTFFCKECKTQAGLEELTARITVVECPTCKVAEYWVEVDQVMDWFDYEDQKMGDC